MNIGLVCISEILKDKNKQNSFQTMTRSRFLVLDRKDAITQLSSRIKHNASLCAKIILHCHEVGIKHYRVSSNLFPLITDESLGLRYADLPDFEEIQSILAQAGDIASKLGVSLSSHPDQFNVLPSHNPYTVRRTISELNHQSYVLDLLGCPQDYSAPMCLHLNLSLDTKKETIFDYVIRFTNAFNLCDTGVRKRLVLENEDKGFWNCSNLYKYFKPFPLVFDNLHDAINPSDFCHFKLFRNTWGNYRPIMHWSEGTPDNPRSHAEYASHIPKIVTDYPDCVWEFELKSKDRGILQILREQKHVFRQEYLCQFVP
jgi:UV DNA damage endonuclease